jgi:hypothetical protein
MTEVTQMMIALCFIFVQQIIVCRHLFLMAFLTSNALCIFSRGKGHRLEWIFADWLYDLVDVDR